MTDMNINPGVRGHTRSTWRDETHLRGLLLQLITQHPKASREELEEMYLAHAEGVPALVDEALHRAFDNDMARIQQPARRPQGPSANELDAAEGRLRTIILLDLVQPNGKKLRDCTGKECREAGGWLIKVADRIGDHGVVGATLDEAAVAAIFSAKPDRRARAAGRR
jgi:hypothetical protein